MSTIKLRSLLKLPPTLFKLLNIPHKSMIANCTSDTPKIHKSHNQGSNIQTPLCIHLSPLRKYHHLGTWHMYPHAPLSQNTLADICQIFRTQIFVKYLGICISLPGAQSCRCGGAGTLLSRTEGGRNGRQRPAHCAHSSSCSFSCPTPAPNLLPLFSWAPDSPAPTPPPDSPPAQTPSSFLLGPCFSCSTPFLLRQTFFSPELLLLLQPNCTAKSSFYPFLLDPPCSIQVH